MARRSIREKGEFLADAIFAASDGIVTTFAIVAGSAGAGLVQETVLILGFANLFADGFSMASGRYLSVKSEIEYERSKGKGGNDEGTPFNHAMATFISFGVAGFIPLVPFVLGTSSPYFLSSLSVCISLLVVGILRSLYTRKNIIYGAIETFVIGGFAAFVAYFVGYLLESIVGKTAIL